MKKLLLATLLTLTTLTVGATTVKADDMRDKGVDFCGNEYSCGYMTLEDHTKGADFSWGYYEDDETNGLVYFKIVNKNTVKLVGFSDSVDSTCIDTDYLTYNGVTYRNIVIGNFKNNKKIKDIDFRNVDTVKASKSSFENSNIEYVTLKGCKEIPTNCFKNCKNLKGVCIEDAHKLKVFGKNSFYNCKKLGAIGLKSKYFTSFDATAKYMKKTGKIKFIGSTVFKNAGYFRLTFYTDDNSWDKTIGGSWTAAKIFDTKSYDKLVQTFDLAFIYK